MKNLSALKYVVLVLAVLFPFSVFGDDSAITYNRIVQSAAHDYTAGFKFTVRDNPIMITELMGYSDATQVSIWAEGGGAPLRSVDLPDGSGWRGEILDPPLELAANASYRIAVYAPDLYYAFETARDFTALPAIEFDHGCYCGTVREYGYPGNSSRNYLYGVVNFKYEMMAADAITDFDSPIFWNGGAWDYTLGFQFTVGEAPITITKVMGHDDAEKVSIWAEGGDDPLRSVNLTIEEGWTEVDLIPPLELASDETYRIAVYTTSGSGVSKYGGGQVFSSPDIILGDACYGNAGQDEYPTWLNDDYYLYGLVNFSYTKSE